MRLIKKGATDQSIEIYIIDSTDGTPETGVVWNSAGIDLKYRREGGAVVAITEATLASLTTAHTDGGFLTIGNGVYRFDIPDAAFATGADSVVIFGTVTGMIVLPVTLQLVDNIEKDTYDRIGAAGAGLTDLGGMSTGMKAEINTQADLALTDYDPPTRAELTSDKNEIITDLDDVKGTGFVKDTHSLTDILTDVTGLNGDVMRGTDGANTTTPPTVSAIQAEMEEEGASLLDTIRDDLANGTDGLGALKTLLDDIQGATFSSATDSLEAIRDRGDAAWTTGAGGSDRLLMVDTTIATLTSQTSFTLTAGSADDNAYNNCTIVIEDAATSTQKAVGLISAYIGATKTVTLRYDPGIFTIVATDKVYILAENALKSIVQNRQLDVDASGYVTASTLGAQAKLDVNAEVDIALSDIDLDHLLNNGTGVPVPASGTIYDSMGILLEDIQGTTFSSATDSLEAIRDRGDAAWITLSQAFPANFADMSITSTTGFVNITQAAADKVWSTTTRTLTSLGTLVADIWAELLTSITTTGSIGKHIKDFLYNIVSLVESQRVAHTHQVQGKVFYVDSVNGDTHANGNRGDRDDPYNSIQDCIDNAVVTRRHDCIILIAGNPSGVTIITETVTVDKAYVFIRGPGKDVIWTRSGSGDTITVSANGIELSGFQLETDNTGVGKGISAAGIDHLLVQNIWVNDTQGSGIDLSNCSNCRIINNVFESTGVSGAGHGIAINNVGGPSNENFIGGNVLSEIQGDGIRISGDTTMHTHITDNHLHDCDAYGINILTDVIKTLVANNISTGNGSGNIQDTDGTADIQNNGWQIDAIEVDTNELQSAGVKLSTQGKADVNTEVDTALSDIDLDHLVNNGIDVPTPTGGTLFDDIMNKDGSQTFDPTTDSLEAISDSGGGGLTQQQVRDSMKLSPTAGAPSSGSVDEHLDDIPTVEEIDAELSANHGVGSWGAGGTVVLPVMQGEVYSAVAQQSKDVKIVKGDTPRIVFDLGEDYLGWTIWFGAKSRLSDTVYVIDPKQCTWTDASKGQGYVDLTVSETATIGKFFAELELRQGAQRLTAMKYKLTIIEDVIDA